MKLVQYIRPIFIMGLIGGIQGCRPAQVTNVRSNFNAETKNLR